ncbi:MAG TPA: hypothetical protein PLN19_05220, partial [Methanothrix sp.]|nr:hypothetical protein [Methanothrix sp.]HQE87658.1 hypothetical protein [Methanothrix sp.]HQI68755.1 hypothetical protein [Methanothrix sp.]HRS84969.1 hypothetical protein [Methanothrix sp.]HRT17085.1 hypothetical protein [Methanothrix sp.]
MGSGAGARLDINEDQPCWFFFRPRYLYPIHSKCCQYIDLFAGVHRTGGRLDARALSRLQDEPGVIGLAEVMNYPGVLFRDAELMKKLSLAGS